MPTCFDNRILWLHWKGAAVGEKTIDDLAKTVKKYSPNAAGIAIKVADGADWQGKYDTKASMAIKGPESIQTWAQTLKNHGLETHLWCVIRGDNVEAESKTIIQACNVSGVCSMILDVEDGPQYFGDQEPGTAKALVEKVRAGIPKDFHLALCLDARGTHPANIFIDEWIPGVQSLHPMVYHWHFSEATRGPQAFVDEAFNALEKYKLPIVPMLQAYPDPTTGKRVPPDQMYEAAIYSFQKGAAGVTYYSLGKAGAPEFQAVARIDLTKKVEIVTVAPKVETAQPVPPKSEPAVTEPVQPAQATQPAQPTQPVQPQVTQPAQTQPTQPTPVTVTITTKVFQVMTPVLKVRTEPSAEPRTLVPSVQLQMGDKVEVDPNSRTVDDGYIWWKHSQGWSAEREDKDGGEILMADPSTISTATTVPTSIATTTASETATNVNPSVPQPAFFFSRLPMDLDKMRWFYYYGNTVFAYKYGYQYNYQGYSQALHGGIDFGHSGGIPVYAGVNGTFQYSGSGKSFTPYRVDVKVGDYLIIYGHIVNPISLSVGQPVTPDTVVGMIDSGMKHTHIEIRYKNFIYNPLLFIAEPMRDQLIVKFPPKGEQAFYTSNGWTKWITPLDQPVITLGGAVIGPPH